MKYIVYIDCGVDNVPYKSFGIKSQLRIDEVGKILNDFSNKFKIDVSKYCGSIMPDKKFYNLEEAIIKVMNVKFEYTTDKYEFVETFKRIEDGVISHDEIKDKIIVVKDGMAYYKITKSEKHKRKYIIPNTNNNEDIIVEDL